MTDEANDFLLPVGGGMMGRSRFKDCGHVLIRTPAVTRRKTWEMAGPGGRPALLGPPDFFPTGARNPG